VVAWREQKRFGTNYCNSIAGELWQDESVARKRKKKEFRAATEVRAIARERIGTPPGQRVVPDLKKKKKDTKHKPSLGEMLGEG
jgi:hypothetical protein